MSTSHMSRAAVGAVALLLAVFVAACDEDEPSPAPAPSGSATESESTPSEPTSTSAEPIEPTPPPQALSETRAGARAFAEYYWEAVNAAQATGNTEPLAELSVATCTGCNGGIDAIDRIYERGGRIIGGRNAVLSTTLLRKPSGGWSATQVIRVGKQRIRGAGDLNQVSRAGRVDVVLGLTYRVDHWVVSFLEV